MSAPTRRRRRAQQLLMCCACSRRSPPCAPRSRRSRACARTLSCGSPGRAPRARGQPPEEGHPTSAAAGAARRAPRLGRNHALLLVAQLAVQACLPRLAPQGHRPVTPPQSWRRLRLRGWRRFFKQSVRKPRMLRWALHAPSPPQKLLPQQRWLPVAGAQLLAGLLTSPHRRARTLRACLRQHLVLVKPRQRTPRLRLRPRPRHRLLCPRWWQPQQLRQQLRVLALMRQSWRFTT